MKYVTAFLSALSLSLSLVAIGCKEPELKEDDNRITASLDTDGYALFKVTPNTTTSRVAVLVEMRNAPPGTYVLLHTARSPESVGWFALDVDAYSPCRQFGKDAVVETQLDCIVPDGRGEIVDIVTVDSNKLLFGGATDDAGKPVGGTISAGSKHTETTILRHSIYTSQFYAVMRVEYGYVQGSFAVEARPVNESSSSSATEPTVKQILVTKR